MDGVKLEFTDKALMEIARMAKKRKLGARGLKAIMEELMTEIMFHAPSYKGIDKIVITDKHVKMGRIDFDLIKKAV